MTWHADPSKKEQQSNRTQLRLKVLRDPGPFGLLPLHWPSHWQSHSRRTELGGLPAELERAGFGGRRMVEMLLKFSEEMTKKIQKDPFLDVFRGANGNIMYSRWSGRNLSGLVHPRLLQAHVGQEGSRCSRVVLPFQEVLRATGLGLEVEWVDLLQAWSSLNPIDLRSIWTHESP